MSAATELHVGVLGASRFVARAAKTIATSQAIFAMLGAEPLSLAVIAWRIGRPKETVRQHLLDLRDAGLVARLPRGEWVAAWAVDEAATDPIPSTSLVERCGSCCTVLVRGICPNGQCSGTTS